MEEKFIEIIRAVYEAVNWPGVALLMAIESAGIPFPSELIMPFAGWFLVKDAGLGVEWVFVLGVVGAVGNLLGSLVAYWAGAIGGRPFLNRYGKYFLISHRDLAIADRWFAKRGDWIVLVSRLLPVVRTYISLPAGIARMNIWRFSIFTLIGAYPFCLGLAYGGYKLGEHWEDLRNTMRPLDIPIGIVLVVLAGLYVWRHVRHLREEPKAGW